MTMGKRSPIVGCRHIGHRGVAAVEFALVAPLMFMLAFGVYDLVAGTTQRRELGKGRIGGEFVFVPASADAAEGEGWLMTYLNDLPSGTGELVVLDAQDLSDVARVHLPRRVPVGFHGNWIPDSAVRD